MRCIICNDWSESTVECDFCDSAVCEDCVVEGDTGESFCSEECQIEFYMN